MSPIERNARPWEKCSAHIEISVAWRDLDAYGHVNNAVYFSYFEMIRIHYFTLLPGFRKNMEEKGILRGMMEGRGSTMTLVNTSCTYKRQAFLNQKLVVGMKVTGVRRSFVDMQYTIYDREEGFLVAEGSSVHAVVDAKTFRAKKISPEFLADMETLEGRKLSKPEKT